jgi:hypothetical protein
MIIDHTNNISFINVKESTIVLDDRSLSNDGISVGKSTSGLIYDPVEDLYYIRTPGDKLKYLGGNDRSKSEMQQHALALNMNSLL